MKLHNIANNNTGSANTSFSSHLLHRHMSSVSTTSTNTTNSAAASSPSSQQQQQQQQNSIDETLVVSETNALDQSMNKNSARPRVHTQASNSSSTSFSMNAQNQCGHKFEVTSFHTIEKCEYCCGIMYGICRQAVRCESKGCNYLCHPKCRQFLPNNCPININQRMQLKGVDFSKGIGTLMAGYLKVPKLGAVKKGWQENYVIVSNARLFVFPLVENNKPSLTPTHIIDMRDPEFFVGSVNEADVIHANKKDLPCILKLIVSKFKLSSVKQKFLFCAKDENEKNSWVQNLYDLNKKLTTSPSTNSNILVSSISIIFSL